MSYPDTDWLRAVIQQTVREMLPEIIQAVTAEVDRNLTIDLETPEMIAAVKQIGVPGISEPGVGGAG